MEAVIRKPVRVTATRVDPTADDLASDLRKVEVLAKWLDGQYTIAGLPIGYAALIDLIPVAGDAISATIGLYPVFLARKHKLGKVVIARMLANLGVEFVAGIVPVVGDALDVLIRANLKNAALFRKAAVRKHPALG